LLRTRRDLTRRQLERTRALMDASVRDCLVEGFEDLIDELNLPDPGDRHVLAAAIRAEADRILTRNLKHFPDRDLAGFRITAQEPDAFVAELMETESEAVARAARNQRRSLKNPSKSVDEYLETLEKQGLTATVARLRNLEALLD